MPAKKSFLAACLASLALQAPAAFAADWAFPGDFITLQETVDAAATGDRILVAPGTYRESVVVVAKEVSFVATGGPDVTTLDGEGVRQLFFFDNGASGLVEGFTLVNGSAWQGGAVYAYHSSVTVRDCTLRGNHASNGGAVAAYWGASVMLEDSRVIGNSADGFGGGGYGDVGTVSGTRTLFSGNTANYGGALATGSWCGSTGAIQSVVVGNSAAVQGGAFFGAPGGESCRSHVFISGSLVAGNVAVGVGGAIVSWNAAVQMAASTLVGNRASAGGALHASATTPIMVRGSILWDNGDGSIVGGPTYQTQQYAPWAGYNDITASLLPPDAPTGFPGDASNLTGDPRFADAAAGDYHLLPGSPAIDAAPFFADYPATSATDLDGVPRPQGAATDMGAYEVRDLVPPVTTATVTGPAGQAGWYVGPVGVALAATDAGGVREILFSLDGAAETSAAGASADVTVTSDGPHALAFHAVDSAGNVEAVQVIQLKVDQTAPVPAAPGLSGTVGSNGWFRSAVAVTLSATDATSGVAALNWSVNGGAPRTAAAASTTLSVFRQGTTAVAWSVVDVAGSAAAGAPVSLKIDSVAPTVQVSATPATLRPNTRLQAVMVTASATDATSGVATLTIRVTDRAGVLVGIVAPGGTIQLQGTRGQRYTFTATATDAAGNSRSAISVVTVG